ncbi:unnamed protein product [Pipistrellus nathusii]|uniref:NFAM1 Ig-like domain-containing protein n=1 Tax=Pipistrellus nathusii TaxID=59473 RepID=A0ABP0A0G5_PIPNA
MESRPRPRAPRAAPWLLGLLLSPWTLRLTGGQSVERPGPPILASLANQAVSFSCRITYPYTPEFRVFSVSYFYVNRQGQESAEEPTGCQPGTGQENQTLTTACRVAPRLPSALATGTYYCSVRWPHARVRGPGTFILVRDTGYREPPRVPEKILLFGFLGLLAALSVLATALLLWQKKQMRASWRQLAQRIPAAKIPPPKIPAPSTASPKQPPEESAYMALQRQDTGIYACMQSEAGSPPARRSFLSQENAHRCQSESEFNLVYENL